MPVLSRLAPTIASAYALQALFASVFVPQQNDKFYDLCGAIGWLSTTAVSLYYPSLKAKYWDGVPGPLSRFTSFAPRQILLSCAVGFWSLRLGTFLAMRAINAGGDSRFKDIKTQPKKFAFFWMAQATWITVVGLPVFFCNALASSSHPALGRRDFLGLSIYAGSLLFEIVADRQKTQWRRAKENKQHDEKFISSGLWSISRHPNYVGEVGIWTGIWVLSTRALQQSTPMVYLAAASPLFTYWLLRYVSGVPPLQRAGDEKFGSDPRWLSYKQSVPVFWPWGSVSA